MQRATSRSREVTGEGLWDPPQCSQLIHEGQAGLSLSLSVQEGRTRR